MELKIKKIFVNGSFDILHYGHLTLLNYAKSLGDYLLAGIDSDERISFMKGRDRPFNNEFERFNLLKNLKAVDEVFIFNSDLELRNKIKDYNPDIMLVGSDWYGKEVIGSEFAKELIYFKRTYNESTTKKLESYINRRRLYR